MPILFVCVFYWMIDLSSTAEQFFLFYLISVLIGICGNSLGLLLGSIITDEKSIATAAPIVLIPFVVLSGYFKNTGTIPEWIGWAQYISPFKYGFAAMIENETKNKASLIDVLNLNVSFWLSIGLLVVLAFSYRLLSLFFLWLLRKRMQ